MLKDLVLQGPRAILKDLYRVPGLGQFWKTFTGSQVQGNFEGILKGPRASFNNFYSVPGKFWRVSLT